MTRHIRRPALGVEPLEDRSVPAVITVTTLTDVTQPGDGQLTLREALLAANRDGPGLPPDPDVVANSTGPFGDDTIRFAAGLTGTIFLPGGTLPVGDDLTIDGPGAAVLTVSGRTAPGPGPTAADRVFEIDGQAGAVTLRGLTVADGRPVEGSGAGVRNGGADLTIDRVRFLDNRTDSSGGAVSSSGRLTVTDSLFQGNASAFEGGAVAYNEPGPGAGLAVSGSAFVGNTARVNGGGIAVESQTGPRSVVNSTFAGNAATLGQGGGVYAGDGTGAGAGSVIRLVQVTASGNTAFNGGGVASETGTGVLLFNSIVAGNTATDPGGFADLGGGQSQGGNVLGEVDPDTAAGLRPSDLAGVADAGLAPLDLYGGTLPVFALRAGSPALGRGLAVGDPPAGLTASTAPPADQRGRPRPSGGAIDAGAFQAQRPTANPDSFTVGQNRPLTVPPPGLLGNDVNNDVLGPLTAILNGPEPVPGSLRIDPSGSIVYTPPDGFVGVVTFSYVAFDGVTTSAPATVTVGVAPAVPPTVNPDAFDLGGGRALTVAAPGVLANDAANDIFRPLAAVLDTPPAAADGTVALNADGSFTFAAAGTFDGTATFTYRVTDGLTSSQPAAVTITGTAAARLYAFGAGAGGGPRVRVFAADGTPRFDFFAFEPTFAGGVRVAVGDVTGDRVDDVVAAAGPGAGPRVAVFDGATGARVRDFFAYEPTFSLGVHVAAADVDGDGFADIVTGTGSGGGPRVQAFSGRDPAAVLVNFFPYNPLFRGGVRVGAGDLTGDGRAEVVTAAGPSGGPDIAVYEVAGRLAVERNRFFGFDPGYRGGAFVSVGRSADGSARLYVAPDSFPDFRGSELGDQFPLLSDTLGFPQGVPASAALLTRRPEVAVFAVSADGRGVRADGTVPVLSAGSTGGVRVAGGTLRGQPGVFVAAGPGGGGRVQFFPLGAGGLAAPALDLQAFDPGFLDSVYVGAGV